MTIVSVDFVKRNFCPSICIEIVRFSSKVQGGSNMTGTVTGLFTHKQSRSYLNHLALKNIDIPYPTSVLTFSGLKTGMYGYCLIF